MLFIFESERASVSTSGEGAEMETHIESKASCRLRAVSTDLDMGSNPQTARS